MDNRSVIFFGNNEDAKIERWNLLQRNHERKILNTLSINS
jgi:hypothetical protein